MAHVLVTGATGFVGRNLVERLRSRGDHVRCLVRKTASPAAVSALTDLGAELVPGDVTDPSSLPAAVADVDVVFHLAGLSFTFDIRQFPRINTEGPRNVGAACRSRDRPPVLVSVSSLAAAGPSAANQPRSEEQPPNPVSLYGRSKWQGEVALHSFADRVPITILRPPGVFGPWDTTVLEAFRMVKHGWHLAPGWTPQRVALVAVGDLVEALLAAAEKGERLVGGDKPDVGYRGYYFIAHDDQQTYPDLGRLMAEALGRRSPWTLRVPFPLCWPIAGLAEGVGRLRGRPSLLNLDKMREATAGSWICKTDRARDRLGWRPRAPLVDQLRETAQWYSERAWL